MKIETKFNIGQWATTDTAFWTGQIRKILVFVEKEGVLVNGVNSDEKISIVYEFDHGAQGAVRVAESLLLAVKDQCPHVDSAGKYWGNLQMSGTYYNCCPDCGYRFGARPIA
jgi:hypothetical protein